MRKSEVAIIVTVVMAVAFFTGFIVGGVSISDSERENAIEAGVAYYKVDPKTGETSFVYIIDGGKAGPK